MQLLSRTAGVFYHRVIYNPFLDELYQAVRGHGAFLNTNTRLPLSHPNPLPLNGLGEALIAVEWGSDRSGEVRDGLKDGVCLVN